MNAVCVYVSVKRCGMSNGDDVTIINYWMSTVFHLKNVDKVFTIC